MGPASNGAVESSSPTNFIIDSVVTHIELHRKHTLLKTFYFLQTLKCFQLYSSGKIQYVKNGLDSQRESEMMRVRWQVFEFFYRISQSQ